jgi:hypothetical protein
MPIHRDRGSEKKRQNQGECQGNQNLAGEIEDRERAEKQHNPPRTAFTCRYARMFA